MTLAEFGATGEDFGIRLSMALGGCRHQKPIPVTALDGEVVAALCTDCDALSEPCRAHSR